MTADHLGEFTRDGYRRLLSALLDRGYTARNFLDADTKAAHLIVRHDIDFSLDAVRPIADIESDLGVSASYFFLMQSPFYSVESRAAAGVFDLLQRSGHTVGLHFDAAPYAEDAAALESAVEEECARLEDVTGQAVTVVSFHRPAKSLLGRIEKVAGRPHTYQPVYFEQMGYCSDSRGRWRHGHPLENSAVTAGTALQLLTHPIWWAHDDAGNRERALQRLIDALGPSIRTAIADTVTGYDTRTGIIAD